MKKLILPLLSLSILLSAVDGRIWTSQSGQTFEGELIEADDKSATIRRTTDRRKFKMAINALSDADQSYLKHFKEQLKPKAEDNFDFFGLINLCQSIDLISKIEEVQELSMIKVPVLNQESNLRYMIE